MNKMLSWTKTHRIIIFLIVVAVVAIAVVSVVRAPSTDKNNGGVTRSGEVVCLPHRNSDGPQTLECAAGLKVGNTYYGLRNSNTDGAGLAEFVGKKIEVTGKESTEKDSIYKIDSTILVDNFREL